MKFVWFEHARNLLLNRQCNVQDCRFNKFYNSTQWIVLIESINSSIKQEFSQTLALISVFAFSSLKLCICLRFFVANAVLQLFDGLNAIRLALHCDFMHTRKLQWRQSFGVNENSAESKNSDSDFDSDFEVLNQRRFDFCYDQVDQVVKRIFYFQ